MKIIISNVKNQPIYEQIYEQIKNLIITEELKAGEMLPSIRGLAKDLRISVITTKRAYDELEKDGFINSVAGKGCFVAEKNLELVGLKECAHSHIHELSGGMKQRVALARALATSPRILLMDEPFAALDAMTREQLYQDIQDIHFRCGMTIIFVTHNMREAVCLGDRVVLFTPHPGRVCEEYFVDLPHPRDINSRDLAQLSSRITRDLKGAMA